MKRKSTQKGALPDRNVTPQFTKEQFLQSGSRTGREKDILAAVLKENQPYTVAEAEAAIQSFLNREVV